MHSLDKLAFALLFLFGLAWVIIFYCCIYTPEKESNLRPPQYKVELLNTKGEVIETKFAHKIYEVGFYKGQYRFEYYYFVKYKTGGGYFKCQYYTINKKDVQITKGTFSVNHLEKT